MAHEFFSMLLLPRNSVVSFCVCVWGGGENVKYSKMVGWKNVGPVLWTHCRNPYKQQKKFDSIQCTLLQTVVCLPAVLETGWRNVGLFNKTEHLIHCKQTSTCWSFTRNHSKEVNVTLTILGHASCSICGMPSYG